MPNPCPSTLSYAKPLQASHTTIYLPIWHKEHSVVYIERIPQPVLHLHDSAQISSGTSRYTLDSGWILLNLAGPTNFYVYATLRIYSYIKILVCAPITFLAPDNLGNFSENGSLYDISIYGPTTQQLGVHKPSINRFSIGMHELQNLRLSVLSPGLI